MNRETTSGLAAHYLPKLSEVLLETFNQKLPRWCQKWQC